MDKPQFPPYDAFEKTQTKSRENPIGKRKKRKCFHNATYYIHAVLSNLGICVVIVGYTLLGSFIFLYIERRGESKYLNKTAPTGAEEYRIRAVENIWEITVSLNILYRENWTRLAGQEISKFQDELVNKITDDIMRGKGPVERPPIDWTFAKSFLYSLTVLTTIGYGGLSPQTPLGKIATIIYAIIGIPLMLLYLSSIGSVLSRCARGVCSRTLCCCLCSNCGYCCYDEKRMQEKERRMKRKRELEEMQSKQLQDPFFVRSNSNANFDVKEMDDDWSVNLHSTGSILAPLGLCVMIMLTYILLGSFLLIKLESWPFLDCCYFCFMSLSTINLTDVIILKKNTKNITIWLCSLYILTGLALTAMCFNILHEELLKRLKNQLMKGLVVKKDRERGTELMEPSPDLYSNS